MLRRTGACMMRPTSALLDAWREKMPYARYVSIATRYLHKGLSDKNYVKYIRFSEPCFEAVKPSEQGATVKVDVVPNEYEKM
ncbi:hypothetical protein DIPPA_22576 [Diplonema papillatum]|nr:hypothetical protein DIPPA_22576 [Diplonema papillatum]